MSRNDGRLRRFVEELNDNAAAVFGSHFEAVRKDWRRVVVDSVEIIVEAEFVFGGVLLRDGTGGAVKR